MAEALNPAIPDRIDLLTRHVLTEACMRGVMLATAESCTGGLLASLLTDIPGCSHAFDRGIVAYTNEAKMALLGVDRAIIEGDGPVSRACAVAMAEGALRGAKAEIAVSITGWADGGPQPGQEAGLVHFACARRGRPAVHRVERFGPLGRAGVRLGCLEVSLQMFLESLGG